MSEKASKQTPFVMLQFVNVFRPSVLNRMATLHAKNNGGEDTKDLALGLRRDLGIFFAMAQVLRRFGTAE